MLMLMRLVRIEADREVITALLRRGKEAVVVYKCELHQKLTHIGRDI